VRPAGEKDLRPFAAAADRTQVGRFAAGFSDEFFAKIALASMDGMAY